MGIIQTNQWLQKEFNHPIKICERLIPYFNNQNARAIYQQLITYGMYKPSVPSRNNFEKMVAEDTWGKIGEVYRYYHKEWSGPEIPVFVFPIDQTGGLFRKVEKSKSGVSFGDKMILFLSDLADEKEMEALFVHEYHHVCRLNKLKGNLGDYSLLDSMIIEGLAEYAVLTHCGKQYLADWCRLYSEKEIDIFWNMFLKHHINTKKKEKKHNDLLYGHGGIPKLAGYAAGFSIVRDYYQKNPFAVEKTFSIPAKKFIAGSRFQ